MANAGTTQASRPTFGNFGNALLERGNPGLRRSTPDSEALASSDEEIEQSKLRSANSRRALANRRSSLLADQGPEARRSSLAGSSTYSPNPGSHPNTPGVGNDTWSTTSPSVGAWNSATSYPFGNSIWGTRDPPARLSEVPREQDSRLSFSIPSQPHVSTHRSMSFSVGQSDPNSFQNAADTSIRPNGNLVRRTSRPSNVNSELGALRSVSEVEYNEQSPIEPARNQPIARAQSLAFPPSASHSANHPFRSSRLRSSGVEHSENAIDDFDEPSGFTRGTGRNTMRRLSDYPLGQPSRQPLPPSAIGSTFRVRNGPHWSSTGNENDIANLYPIPGSRRHSIDDIPTRRGSLGSNDENSGSYTGSQGQLQEHDTSSYFAQSDFNRALAEQEVQQQLQQERSQSLFGGGPAYGISSNYGAYHGPNTMPLFVVNFKCCRSDIFYVPENSGLTFQPGDLVIVEADRGTDLGCIQHVNITWDEARKYKARYAEQHYSWLMMFSQQTRSGAPNLFNPNATTPGRGGGGASGPGHRDPCEIKPKMIKRLAAPHEVQALQEKEGNEAKAKRVCQQKVQEHNLNMEILDSEFQMDGKKLTFYFFSTEYINFNSLVTDLFKIYKTRIWMSAINPASFQTPTSSLGLQPIYSGTGLGVQNAQLNEPAYDDARDGRNYANTARTNPPNLYANYQSPSMAGNAYAGYAANYQPGTDPFAGYSSYGMMQQPRQPSFGLNRQGSLPRTGPFPSAHSLTHTFGNLSLDRYEPTTSS